MVIQVGNVFIKDHALLAPMSGVTDIAYRATLKSLGADVTFSEMVAGKAIICDEDVEIQKIRKIDDRTIVQIAGHEPEVMAEAAKRCEANGALMIDINFGCPAKKVVNKYAGSAIMQDECLARSIMQAIAEAVAIPVTVKMRTGWDTSNRNAVDIAKIAEESGLRLITVHGRTRAQKFSGKADWKFIRNVKRAVSIPVIANGDITDLDDVQKCLKESEADGVMIGRAAIGRPWIIPEINYNLTNKSEVYDISLSKKLNVIRAHYVRILESYPHRLAVLGARKHLAAYLADLPQIDATMRSILKTEDAGEVLRQFERYANRMRVAA